MALILSQISSPSSLFCRFLRIVPSALTTIGITVTLMFHDFGGDFFSYFVVFVFVFVFFFYCFSFGFVFFFTRFGYLPTFIFHSFSLSDPPKGQKSTWLQVLFFLLINSSSYLMARIGWSICISKAQRILCFIIWSVQIPFGNMAKF